jgi:hypothetical protein
VIQRGEEMLIDDARVNLKEWLSDLSALKPFVDPCNPESQDFLDAWTEALVKAKDAARKYAVVAKQTVRLKV